jgi:hypothetical protein
MAASSRSRSSGGLEMPIDMREDTALIEAGHQDDVLANQAASRINPQFDTSPKRDGTWFVRRSSRWRVLAILTFGTFLATCPLPRQHVPSSLRIFLIATTASLLLLPTKRHFDIGAFVARLAVSYLGFYLSIYAIFGAADEVHLEMRLQSLLWFPGHWDRDWRPGYLTRLALVVASWGIVRRVGLYSTGWMVKTWLLCFAWIYADVGLTTFDMARGREHW